MTFDEWIKLEIGNVDENTYKLLKQGWNAHKAHMNDQRKVLYNCCFGGFTLSAKAVYEIGKRRGITVYAYELADYRKDGSLYKKVDIEDPVNQKVNLEYTDTDLGDTVINTRDANGKTVLYSHRVYYDYIARDDEDLIAVVDQIGLEAASGPCCTLAYDMGSGRYQISDYDGDERVSFSY